MTKRHNIIVIGASVLIAASFWIVPLLNRQQHPDFSYKLFKTADGWGYDILVNDKLQIHQELMPVVDEQKSFPKQAQAKQAALLVIKKLHAGKNPAISRPELEQILKE